MGHLRNEGTSEPAPSGEKDTAGERLGVSYRAGAAWVNAALVSLLLARYFSLALLAARALLSTL
jgi:hypothetical protein